MKPTDLARDFTDYACRKLEQNLTQITRCAALLSPDEMWHRPNANSNSVGNLILHLTGNVRQWIVAGLAGEPFQRDRPAEFAERGPRRAGEIVAALERAVRRATEIISALTARELAARRAIQGYRVSAQVAVFHVVEHFSFHAGQIIHATKTLRDVDLSLYDAHGRKLNGADAQP